MAEHNVNVALHDIFERLRYVLRDHPIVRQIDEAYEETLKLKLKPLGDDGYTAISNALHVIDIAISSFDARGFIDKLKGSGLDLTLHIDVYDYAMEYIKKNIKDRTMRQGLIVVVKYLRQLLDCITIMLQDPVRYLDSLTATADGLDDLLK